MPKTFLAMDMKLCDKEVATKFGMPVAKFNKKIIEKMNKEITDEDTILIGGIFTKGNFLQTLNLISQLKGKKVLINRDQYKLFSEQEYLELGFTHVWNVDGHQSATIKNEVATIIISGRPEYIEKYKNTNFYIAAAGSDIPEQKELYKDHILNTSLEKWDYVPIEISKRLSQIIDDMELFASMEDKEEILS